MTERLKYNNRITEEDFLQCRLMRLKIIFTDFSFFFSISDGSCVKLCHDPQLARENLGQFIAKI